MPSVIIILPTNTIHHEPASRFICIRLRPADSHGCAAACAAPVSTGDLLVRTVGGQDLLTPMQQWHTVSRSSPRNYANQRKSSMFVKAVFCMVAFCCHECTHAVCGSSPQVQHPVGTITKMVSSMVDCCLFWLFSSHNFRIADLTSPHLCAPHTLRSNPSSRRPWTMRRKY